MAKFIGDDKKPNWFRRHKAWAAVIGILVLFCLIGAISGDSSKKPAASMGKPNNGNGVVAPVTCGEKTSDGCKFADSSKASPAPTLASVAPAPAPPSVPAEYKSALASATSYSNQQHMSKQGLYDQLTSQYGEKFTAAAAQYAIDNVKADFNANALATAKDYQSQQNMSPAAIHDQLTSSYGEKFTASEADYAIAHLND